MTTFTIRDPATGSSAEVAPELGFNCFRFDAKLQDETVPVIDAADDFAAGNHRPSGHGIPLLFPFPNRIRDGRFTWDGQPYHLPDSLVQYDRAGNAIHGFCLDRPWRVVDSGEQFVTGEFQLSRDAPERLELWPADFLITVRYALRENTLETRIVVRNPSETPLPWGFGTHAYFRLPLGGDGEPQHCLLQVPAEEQWVLEDGLPTGVRKPVDGPTDLRDGAYYGIAPLDDVLTGLFARDDQPFVETAVIDEPAGRELVQRFSPDFREAVVYTPADRNAVCIEPYTCATDAINLQQRGLDAGWAILEPGSKIELGVDLTLGPLMV